MKVAIFTQIRENYGSADKPYWKCKGGSTFVVPGLTAEQAARVERDGIPTLTALINEMNPMFEEFVTGYTVVEDQAKVCDAWETPFNLFWEAGCWVARRTVENGEYGYMNRMVERKLEEYGMLMGGGKENYRAVYTMRNGDVVDSQQVSEYLSQAA